MCLMPGCLSFKLVSLFSLCVLCLCTMCIAWSHCRSEEGIESPPTGDGCSGNQPPLQEQQMLLTVEPAFF